MGAVSTLCWRDQRKGTLCMKTRIKGSGPPAATEETRIATRVGVRRPPGFTSPAVMPSVGTVLKDRFELLAPVGKGGMGVVFTAKDRLRERADDPNSTVVVKLLGPDLLDHPEAFRLVQQECAKAQKLSHPNVVTVHDFDQDGEQVFITMEHLQGESLEDIEPTAFSPQKVLDIVRQVAAGLGYAHQQGIVHSDLKPGNVFLTDAGEVKLLDLGIARSMEAGGSAFDGADIGALTEMWASPEMFDGAPADPRDDLFALGCLFYWLHSGERPFGQKNAKDAKSEGITPQRLKSLNRRQWHALAGLLALEREQRTPSVKVFLKALKPPPWVLIGTSVGLVAALLLAGYLKYIDVPDTSILATSPSPEAIEDPDTLALIEQRLALAKDALSAGFWPGALAPLVNILTELQPRNAEAVSALTQVLDEYVTYIQAQTGQEARDSLLELREQLGGSLPATHKALVTLAKKLEVPLSAPVISEGNDEG